MAGAALQSESSFPLPKPADPEPRKQIKDQVNETERRFLRNQELRVQRLKQNGNVNDEKDDDDDDNRTRFWARIKSECHDLHQKLDDSTAIAFVTAEQRHKGLAQWDKLNSAIGRMEDPEKIPVVASDLRIFRKMLEELKEKLEEFRKLVSPEDKFTFKRYHAHQRKLAQTSKEITPHHVMNEAKESVSIISTEREDEIVEDAERKQFQIQNENDKTIVVNQQQNPDDETDLKRKSFTVKSLQDCKVVLKNCYGNLYLTSLVRCEVYAYPVEGSIYVSDCTDTNFQLASKQLRIHDSTRVQFNVFVVSGPIIEGCRQVRFGGDYGRGNDDRELQAYRRHMVECSLVNSTDASLMEASNRFRQVRDFGWHRLLQKSPHYEIIEAQQQQEEDPAPQPVETFVNAPLQDDGEDEL